MNFVDRCTNCVAKAALPPFPHSQSIYNTATTTLLPFPWLHVWQVRRPLVLAPLLMCLNSTTMFGRERSCLHVCSNVGMCVCACVWYRWWPTGRWPLIIFLSPYPVPMLCCVFSVINVLLVSHVPDDISRPEQLLCISIRDLKTCMKRVVKVLGWVNNILRLSGRHHMVLVHVFRRQSSINTQAIWVYGSVGLTFIYLFIYFKISLKHDLDLGHIFHIMH